MSPLNNTVNVLFKNFMDLCVGVLFFYLVGYSLMYGDDVTGIGSVAIAAWAFITMLAVFSVLRGLGMARVSKAEELAGLDLIEHGETEGAAET